MENQEKGTIKTSETKMRQLSESIGDFMRYWGFRKIHGAIWTQIYLSREPLSCTQLAQRLKVSKALISPALEELSSYHLIYSAESPNEKVKLYRAQSDVQSVILSILRQRESKMIQSIQNNFSPLSDESVGGHKSRLISIDKERHDELSRMIASAQLVLTMITSQTDLFALPDIFSINGEDSPI